MPEWGRIHAIEPPQETLMFETAEVGNRIEKADYVELSAQARSALLEAQTKLASSDTAIVVIVGGVEGAGKRETVNLLMEWLDARGVQVHTLMGETGEEHSHPPYWRFWRALPPKGKLAIMFGSWYSQPIVDYVFHTIDQVELDRQLRRITDFELMLANEGVVLVKFWMHMAKDALEKRLKRLSKDKATAWRVTDLTWKFVKKYDKFRRVSEACVRASHTGFAPWHIVEATDDRYRNVTVANTITQTIDAALKADAQRKANRKLAPDLAVPKPVNILRSLDLTVTLSAEQYAKELRSEQARVNVLTQSLFEAKRSMILVFEGPDAAGKGGTIRRLTEAMDARDYRVTSVAAPTDEERAHPYLWRFWRDLPAQGRVTIYDRSWYGRVLVERIEGFCAAEDWQRAYVEINAFEEQLTEAGVLVLKFWLAISAEEQFSRFKDREFTPYKQYKLTEEDWRNRAKWDAYEAAACDMVQYTGTEQSPWVLVEAVDKNWARIKVLKTVCNHLERALGKAAKKRVKALG
jgi:polyphosphate:AMP phosphotransferase